MTNTKDNVTLVSGYWNVKSKHLESQYEQWFKNTLAINQRMIFFCDEETIPLIKKYRGDLETEFVIHKITDFYSNAFYNDFWFDKYEIPSGDLGKIWHEKSHMVKMARDRDGDNATEYYVWYDAGNCLFRNEKPPPERLNFNHAKLTTNAISYSGSYPPQEDHFVSGSTIIIPEAMIDDFHKMFYRCVRDNRHMNDNWKLGSDQVIMSMVAKKHPRSFHKVSEGYGENIRVIYKL